MALWQFEFLLVPDSDFISSLELDAEGSFGYDFDDEEYWLHTLAVGDSFISL